MKLSSGRVRIVYTNHREETAIRTIVPFRIWMGQTDYHTNMQWLLDAFDEDKKAERIFAMKDILVWDI